MQQYLDATFLWLIIYALIAIESIECSDEANQTVINPDENVSIDLQVRLNEISPVHNKCATAPMDLDRCSAQLISFDLGKDSFPSSMEEMNSVYCPLFKQTVDCIKTSSECYKSFEKQIINWVLTSSRRMNYKRCKSDNEKLRFIKMTHSCFSPVRDPMDKCMRRYIASLESIAGTSELNDGNDEDGIQIQLSCCANMRFKQCVVTNAKQQCKPLDSFNKLKRTNSVSSQRVAQKSFLRASADMMDDLRKTLDSMALTGPEFICHGVDENFCRTKFDGRFTGGFARHKSVVPAMIQIYSSKQE